MVHEVNFKHGDLVFGKVRGYPPWPARVDETLMPGLKVTKNKVPVFFFGTHEIGILAPKDVFLYTKHKKALGVPQKRTGFNEGLYEIEHKPYLTLDKKANPEGDSSDETTTESDSSSEDERRTNKKMKLTNGTSKGEHDAVHPKPQNISTDRPVHSMENTKNVRKPPDACETSSSSEDDSSSSDDDDEVADSNKSDSDKSWKNESQVEKRPLSDKKKVSRPNASIIYPLKKNNYAEKWKFYCERQLNNVSAAQTKPTPVSSKTTTVTEEAIIPKELEVICFPTDSKPATINVASKLPEITIIPIGLTQEVKNEIIQPETIPLFQLDKENGTSNESILRNVNGKLQTSNANEESPNPIVLTTVPATAAEQSMIKKSSITARKARRLKQQMEAGELVADEKLKKKIARKEEEKEQKKKEKYERKKREKCLLLRAEVKLRALDLRIKESLNVAKQDIDKCIDALEKMDTMNVTTLMLKKNPDIVFTLRKCCRFKNSEKVRLKADYMYNKFKSMFLVGQGETFAQVFQKDIRNLKELAGRLRRDVTDMTEEILPVV